MIAMVLTSSAPSPQLESIAGEVFRPRERIKKQEDFARVARHGRVFRGKLFHVKYVENGEVAGATCSRLGMAVPKKKIKRAVDRNLVKRRLRDIYRKNKPAWPENTDLVVYCTEATLAASYAELRDEMLYWGNVHVASHPPRRGGKRGGGGGGGKKRNGGGKGGGGRGGGGRVRQPERAEKQGSAARVVPA